MITTFMHTQYFDKIHLIFLKWQKIYDHACSRIIKELQVSFNWWPLQNSTKQSFPFQQHYSVSFWGSEQNVATNIYYSSKVPKAYWMALSILIHVLKLKSRFSQCSKQTSWFFRSNYPLTLSLYLYFPLRCFL